MVLSESSEARTGLLIVLGVSAGLVVLHLDHAFGAGEDFQTFLFGILIPMGLAIGVFLGGIWLCRGPIDGEYFLRVATWCVVGAFVLATGASLTILYQQAEGVNMSDQLFVVVNGASIGAVVGFVVGVYDSRQRAAQSESSRLSQQLTVLNRVLRQDIRNDANIIQGNAALLTEDPTDVDEKALRIQRQAADLVKLGEHAKEIEQLLQGTDAEREPVDVAPLVETCCERVSRDYPDADIDVSIPETQIVVAHPLIDSALGNVIENAVEHNEGHPRVEIDAASLSHGGTDFFELRIADNGPGIPEREIAALERGYETDLEHTSGLGLWLVNWIVTDSEGEVRFEENEPTGSVVCLRLERAEATVTSTPASSHRAPVEQPS